VIMYYEDGSLLGSGGAVYVVGYPIGGDTVRGLSRLDSG